MCVVYEVRRKGIIYCKTYLFSLFTPCLGIKVRLTKVDSFFSPKVSNSLLNIGGYCAFVRCNVVFAIWNWTRCLEWERQVLPVIDIKG